MGLGAALSGQVPPDWLDSVGMPQSEEPAKSQTQTKGDARLLQQLNQMRADAAKRLQEDVSKKLDIPKE